MKTEQPKDKQTDSQTKQMNKNTELTQAVLSITYDAVDQAEQFNVPLGFKFMDKFSGSQ